MEITMIGLLTLPRGEGIPWPSPEAWPLDLRIRPAPPRHPDEPRGIVIRPGSTAEQR
jgi:hypothetical protein